MEKVTYRTLCVMSVDINYLKNLICILHRARFDRPHSLNRDTPWRELKNVRENGIKRNTAEHTFSGVWGRSQVIKCK